jgi:hypothetical protein
MLLKKYTSILFLLFSFGSFAQNDTIEIKNELDSTQYLTPMEYAFMFHEDTPWMIKGGVDNSKSIFLAFEKRIKGGFTANISLKYQDDISYLNYNNILIADFSVRYYYTMRLRNKNRNTPFNLSGNYFSLGYEASNNRTSIEKITRDGVEYSIYNRGLNSTYFLKWGLQRRYLKNGFIDAGIKAAYSLNGDFDNSFKVRSATSIGLAFAKDKSSLNDKNLCSVIKCFESEKSVFKLNLSDLFEFQTRSDFTNFWLNPDLTHEIKLGKSSFSISNTLRASLDFYYFRPINKNSSPSPSRGFIYQPKFERYRLLVNIGYLFETRYYYNLKNRILKGKTGNGLSADYVSLGFHNYYQNDDYINFTSSALRGGDNFNFLQPQFTIGTQRFVGDHFFYDLGLGLRFTDIIDQVRPGNNRSGAELILQNKVGFRF